MPSLGRKFRHVLGIEPIGLAAARATHPLPAQVVARHIAIQQQAIHPVGTRTPMHLAQVHQIAGQPQPRMVVQVARGVEGLNGAIDHGQARGGSGHILGDGLQQGHVGQRAGVQVRQNAVAQMGMHVLEILAPAQLVEELVLHRQAMPTMQKLGHLWHRQQAMGEVGRKLRHRAIEVVSGLGVAVGVNRLQPLLNGVQVRAEPLGFFGVVKRG